MSAPILKDDLLGNLPKTLRDELIAEYAQILRNFRERRWEPAALKVGKLCEVVYSILNGYVSGSFPKKASKPGSMYNACNALANATSFPRSVKIQIPRMLIALYEVRNNRSVGHVGGDVDPNHMDAACVVEMSKWLMSELVRIFHDVSTEEATVAVEGLLERTAPMIWKVGDKLRVLDPNMSMKDKALLLLHHIDGPAPEGDLCRWVEHSNASVFRRDVLRAAHRKKLLEYDAVRKTAQISPTGIRYVEESLLK